MTKKRKNMKLVRRAKGTKGQLPPALKPCPSYDFIRVLQLQFFDNGPNPGKGKSQHAIKIEAYLEDKFDLHQPHWKRTVNLTSPKLFLKWASKALADGILTAEQHAVYAEAADVCSTMQKADDVEWAKCGRIEDKKSHTHYPGQFIFAWRFKQGPMKCHVVVGDDMMVCDTFIHDHFSLPGSGRRKAFGFYDPNRIYERKQEEERQLAEWRERNGITGEAA